MHIPYRILIGSLLVLMIPASVFAKEDGRNRWWQQSDMQQALHLTTDEIEKLDKAYDYVYYRMIEIRSSIRAERLKLRQMMLDSGFDKAAVRAQYRKYQQIRNRLRDERFTFLLEAHDILGHDRFVQLLKMREEKRRRHWSKKSNGADGSRRDRTDRDMEKKQ